MVDDKTTNIVLYYNATKGGVDVVDFMLETAMGSQRPEGGRGSVFHDARSRAGEWSHRPHQPRIDRRRRQTRNATGSGDKS